jgi:hypothetical protein
MWKIKRHPLRERATIVDPNFYAATRLWIADLQASPEWKRPVSSRQAVGVKPFTWRRAIAGKLLSIPGRHHGLARVCRRGEEDDNDCSLKAHELAPIFVWFELGSFGIRLLNGFNEAYFVETLTISQRIDGRD